MAKKSSRRRDLLDDADEIPDIKLGAKLEPKIDLSAGKMHAIGIDGDKKKSDKIATPAPPQNGSPAVKLTEKPAAAEKITDKKASVIESDEEIEEDEEYDEEEDEERDEEDEQNASEGGEDSEELEKMGEEE